MVVTPHCTLSNEMFTIFGSFAQVIEIFTHRNEGTVELGKSHKNSMVHHQIFYKHTCMDHKT